MVLFRFALWKLYSLSNVCHCRVSLISVNTMYSEISITIISLDWRKHSIRVQLKTRRLQVNALDVRLLALSHNAIQPQFGVLVMANLVPWSFHGIWWHSYKIDLKTFTLIQFPPIHLNVPFPDPLPTPFFIFPFYPLSSLFVFPFISLCPYSITSHLFLRLAAVPHSHPSPRVSQAAK